MSTYSIELTGKEMVYFFFKKKKCPKCSEVMKRHKNIESLGEGIGSVGLDKHYYGENNKVTLIYRCEKCNKMYSISELCIGEKKYL